MAASITMDIQARVVGYQEAIAKMKAEFAKVDPGSDIGKKLSKAISSAETQLKGLEKNMFPKVSSDTQIDAVIDKVNRVGEALLSVNQLMQQVGAGDLNLSAFGGDIENFRNQISALEKDLQNKLGQGILDAVKGSEELRTIFQDILGVNLDTAKGIDLFKAIEKGALSAAKATEQAEKTLGDAEKKLNENINMRANVDKGPFGSFDSKSELQEQVREFERQYEQVFANVKQNIQNKLSEVFKGDEDHQEEILDSFFSGLTPANVEQRIQELYATLENAGAYSGNQKRKFYQEVFGIDKSNSSYNDVIKSINFEQANQIKEQFKNLLDSFSSEMNRPVKLEIESLIDSNSLQTAADKTAEEIDKIFNSLQKRYKDNLQKLPLLQEAVDIARTKLQEAQEKQGQITGASEAINDKIKALEDQLKEQQQQIDALTQKLNQEKGTQAQNIRNVSNQASPQVVEQMFPSEAAAKYEAQLEQVRSKEQLIGKIQGVAQRWFSIYAVVRMVSNAIRTVISTIRELDKTITEIAIVTKMDQNTLWGQMGSYIELADKYAASISGVYKVSQLYYQQGLQQADVMALTEQTLKMARISGLDYADATDYMTNAVRSFKLEMQDAQVVVDTYSAVAASSATSVTELASAMSKTASSAQAVGASLQNTTAMLAVMIEATRESPENIGSAMKSIISRYGELKENKTGIDAEGEEYSLNKVDKALQSIGVSIHDVNGEFRDFDDVIFELAEKWDTVDKNTQRYIATVMAGNRQQSRFLALVSSNQRLQEESQIANNSEDAAQLQYLKVLDGVEAKVQNLQNALQSLYLNSGFETAYKNLIDFGTGIIKVFSSMTTIAKQPIPAIIAIGTTFYNVANVFTTVFDIIKTRLRMKAEQIQLAMTNSVQTGMVTRIELTEEEAYKIAQAWANNEKAYLEHQGRLNAIQQQGVDTRVGMEQKGALQSNGTKTGGLTSLFKSSGTKNMMASAGLSIGSLVLTSLSAGLQNSGNKQAAGWTSVGSSALSGLSMGIMTGNPLIAAAGAIGGALLGFVSNLGNIFQSAEDQLKDLQEKAEKANNDFLQKKSSTNDLNTQIKQLKELEKHRYDSIEAEEAYNEAANKMGDTYSNLISSVDEAGNVTIDLIAAENELSKSREEAIGAARKAAIANYKAANQAEKNETAEAKQYRNITGDELREKAEEEVQRQAIQEYVFDVKEEVRQKLSQELEDGENLDEEDIELNWRVTSINEDKIIQALKTRDVSGLTGEELKAYAYAATGQRYDEQSQKFKQTRTKAPSYFQSGKIQDIYPYVEDQTLKEFLMAYDQSPLEVPFDLIKQVQNIEKENLSKNDQIIYASVQSLIQDYEKSYVDINQAKTKTTSVMKSGIAKIVGLEAIGSDKSFQQELINSSGILTEMAMSKLLEDYGSNDITDKEYEDFVGNEDTAGQLETLLQEWNEDLEKLWSNLTTSKKEQVNNLLKNAKKYSETQLKAELANYGFGEEDPITKAVIASAQENAYTVEKLSNKMQNRSEKLANTTIIQAIGEDTLKQNYGGYELESLADLQDQIDTYVEAGKLTVSNANDFIDNYANVLEGLNSLNLDSTTREAAQALIFNNKDWSISGIYELAESLEKMGIDPTVIEQVQGLSKFVPKNFITDMESFADGVANKFEDFQKVLSNGLKGMDLKDAMKVADKLGVSISEFKFEEGKFYFTQDITPEQVEKAYLNWNKGLEDSLNKEYEDIIGSQGFVNKNGTILTKIGQVINSISDWDDITDKTEKINRIKQTRYGQSLGDKAGTALDLYEQFNSSYEALTEEEKKNQTFDAYVYGELSKSWDNAKAALNAATEYEVNAFLIQTGNINTFSEYVSNKLEDGFQDEEEDLLKKAIQSGNLESLQGTRLWPYVQEYVKVVDDTFSNIQKELGESLLDSFQGGKKTFEVTAENLAILQQNKGLFKSVTKTAAGLDSTTENIQIGDILTFEDISEFQKDQSAIYNYINTAATTTKDRLEWLSKTYEAIYSNGLDVTSSWLESGKVNIKDFGNLLINRGEIEEGASTKEIDEKIKERAEDYGLKLSQVTGQYFIENYDAYISQLEDDLEKLTSENSSLEERNETRAKIETARKRQETQKKKATEDVIKSYQNISIEQREAFATAFGKEFSSGQIEKIFGQIQDDGTYKLDVQELRNLLNSDTISAETRAYIEELIAGIADDYLSAISTASDYITKGTTKQADMQKFVNEFNKLTTKKISVSDAFQYDTLLNQFILKNNIFTEYLEAQRIELEKLGMSGDAIDEYIKDQTQTILQQSMDVTSILSNIDKRTRDQSLLKLFDIVEKIDFQDQIKENLLATLKQQRTNLSSDYLWNGLDKTSYLEQFHELWLQAHTIENMTSEEFTQYLIQTIYNGGQAAVDVLKQLKGDEVTSEEIDAVYNAAINRLREASDQLTRGIGETVTGSAAAIIKSIKPEALEELDDGTYVIKSTFDLVAAYNMLYKSMEATNVATTAELNSTYAKMLTAYDQPEIDAISTLNDAMGMTYEALGEMLGRYGIKLADVMAESSKWGLQSIGNGKVQIYDFDTFAKQMKWSPDSQEYLEARKAYNDSLIALDKKIGENLTAEIKAITEAKAGDRINITYLMDKIGIAERTLNEDFLHQYGALVNNGILEISSRTNIPQLINTITTLASKNAGLLPEELAELADAISDYIDNIISLIKNGISGNLKNVDAQKLQSWADQFHLNLDFTQTAEGLKLSQKSAIELYNALKGVDNIKAKLVFDELNKSLQETNEHYKSISDILNRIAEIENMVPDARSAEYEQELALAKEILAVRSTSEDSSFNFMSNKIPGGQNNPINYFNNWADAVQKLQTAMSTSSKTHDGKTHKGLIEYQDWYNIVTELNNLAGRTQDGLVIGKDIEGNAIKLDGSLEAAAGLIEKGASALTVDSTGKIKVALGDIGIDFQAGAGDMSAGIDTGIKEMASSQVKMLDGLIRLLETIVAMEKLGDVTGGDNTIDFGDFFVDNDNGTAGLSKANEQVTKWVDYLLNLDDKESDLYKALDQIKVNNESLRTLLQSAKEGKIKLEDAQALTSVLNSMWQMYKSGEWDLDNLYDSLAKIAEQSGLGGELTLDIDNTTLIINGGKITQIDWENNNTKDVLYKWKEKTGEERKGLINAISRYQAGEAVTDEEIPYVLALRGIVEFNNNGSIASVTVNDKEYSGEQAIAAMRAQALVDAGIDFDTDKTIKEAAEKEEKSISVPVEMGLQTNVHVVSDKDGIHWWNDKKGPYSSKQEMLDEAWDEYNRQQEGAGIPIEKIKTQEQYLWEEWGIREHITAKVTGKNGVEVDVSTDASARKAIEDKIAKLSEEELKFNDTGNLDIELDNGMHIILSGDTIVDTENNIDKAKVEEQLKKQLNIDLQLADTIKVGVTAALTELPDIKFDADTQAALDKINALKDAAKEINSNLKLGTNEVDTSITTNKTTAINNPAKQDIKVGTNEVPWKINSNKTYASNNPAVQNVTTNGGGVATGNVGLAKAQGTLMGELGPELYVQNGRYFVAGQNGPEFVDLAPDAIVFNHLQTRSLLDKGMSPGRGKAVTNERNAVSYAKGNVNGGPAMASASAALAALKQLRAQWNALAQLSTKDLASKGGGGGGGKNDPANFLKDLEKWYNWLQKIAQLEKDITYEESLRNRIASDFNADGLKYYQSQRRSLKDLTEEIATQQDLLESQSKYFKERRAEMNSAENPFTALYTFDENGQLKYQDGALAKLSDLVGRNKLTGEANYTAAEQYQKLVEMGYGAYMEYDSSGNKIDQKEDNWEEKAVQAFWDKVDADQSEMQSLHDSIEDLKNNIENNTQKQNEILKAIEDNQIAVENKVYGALVDLKERTIKELKDQRNAIEKANKDLIDGLNKNLERERQLYANSESDKELTTLQRQLAILQRSGGSASDIANLQNQIASKQKDVYFETQQQEIDALQDASDAQLERLDKQIELEEETLEYQKAHGMLWEQVKEIMMGSPEEIAAYIKENNSSYWGKSSTDLAQTLRKDLFEAEQWKAFYGGDESIQNLVQSINDEVAEKRESEKKIEEKKEEEKAITTSTKAASTTSTSTGGTPSPKKESDEYDKYQFDAQYHWKKKDKSDKEKHTYPVIANGAKCKICGYTLASYTPGNTNPNNTASNNKVEDKIKASTNSTFASDTATKAIQLTTSAVSNIGKGIEKIFHSILGFDEGGTVNYTGLAMVHGTKKKPEHMLSAEAFAAAKDYMNNIESFGSKITSNWLEILSLRESMESQKDAIRQVMNSNTNAESSIIIEHAEVNMHVDKLANSYDSARAADDVMKEMINIARKTNAQNRIGR